MIQPDGYAYAADLEPYINGKPIATDPESFKGVQMAQFAFFLGILKETADRYLNDYYHQTNQRFVMRLGINWDQDAEILSDQDFDDWYHVELVREDA